ncbi:MAG: AmmeMemoRadiSam system protein A [Patescibacteria group bacterium]|nr:AmmeMemoRadiSam system protein A [Patescibacteria group bacterium]
MENNFSEKERKALLKIARNSIEFYLKYRKIPQIQTSGSEKLKEKRAVFVTLKKDEELRGCIGHLEPQYPLGEAVARMAVAAAVGDNRFLPITLEELSKIKIEISILSPLKKISHPSQIKLGEHGVIIKRGFQGGTFLPEVAKEFNYNLEEFLNVLCLRKAGLPADAWCDPETEIYIFTTIKIKE